MDWNKLFTFLAYGSAAAATIIATAGIAAPAWLIPALGAVGALSGKMAASHSTAINQAAVDKSTSALDTSKGDLA